MSSTQKQRQKRKLDELATADVPIALQLSVLPPPTLGPIIASFASAEPGAEIPFTCYYKSDAAAASRDDIDFADQDILVAGQNQHVAFWTRHHAHELDAGHARYIVGLRSRKNNTLTLRDAPVHVVTREVKRLRPDSEDSKAASEKAVQRASLAHAFGTKKSLKAVRARERNQVNVGSMVGVLEVMNQGVGGRTETLPTTDDAQEISDNSRLVPAFNRDAERPEDVYPLSSFLPESELSMIRTQSLESAAGDLARTRKLLPYNRAKYINGHLQTLCSGNSLSTSDRRKVQLLVYMSALMLLRFSQRSLDRSILNEKLKALPQPTIEGLLSRFTSTTRDSQRLQMTSDTETLLLTTLLACCLHLDNFVVDVSIIAQDLSLGIPRVHELFRSLGCKIEVPTALDYLRLNLLDGSLGTDKRAILRTPLTFPKPKTRKARR